MKKLVIDDSMPNLARWYSLVSSNAALKQTQGRINSGIRLAQKSKAPEAEHLKYVLCSPSDALGRPRKLS